MLNRNSNIDLLRGIAMIMIVMSHCYSILKIENEYIYSLFDDFGRLGVLIFILISGYFLSLNADNYSFHLKNHVKTVLKKIKSFYALHLIFMIIMIVIYFIYSKLELLDFKILSNLLLCQSFIPFFGGTTIPYSLNTPTWYLSMMLFIWLLNPIIIKIFNVLKKYKYSFIFVFVFLGFLYLFHFNIFSFDTKILRYFMYINPLINLFIYLIGMLGISVFVSSKIQFKKLSILLMVIAYLTKNIVPIDWRVYYLCLPSMLLIASFINSKEINYNYYNQKIIQIGKYSLLMMISHYPICYLMRSEYKNEGILYFILTLGLVYLCFIVLMNLKKERKS